MKSRTSKIQLAALVAAVAATVLFGGCDKGSDNAVDNTPVPVSIISTINAMPARAVGTTWGAEDSVGITMSSAAGVAIYTNVKYVTPQGDGVFWAADTENEIYFQNKELMDFTAYYPYTDSHDTEADILTAKTSDQTAAGQARYDFLFAQARGSAGVPAVKFTFRHCMSRIVLNFVPGDGVNKLEDIAYKLAAIYMNGSFNTATGEARVEKKESQDYSSNVDYHAAGMSASLIVFPQEEARAGGISLTVTMEGIEYATTIRYPENPENHNVRELLPEHSYIYNVKLNRTGLTVEAPSIVGWESGNGADGEEVPANQQSK